MHSLKNIALTKSRLQVYNLPGYVSSLVAAISPDTRQRISASMLMAQDPLKPFPPEYFLSTPTAACRLLRMYADANTAVVAATQNALYHAALLLDAKADPDAALLPEAFAHAHRILQDVCSDTCAIPNDELQKVMGLMRRHFGMQPPSPDVDMYTGLLCGIVAKGEEAKQCIASEGCMLESICEMLGTDNRETCKAALGFLDDLVAGQAANTPECLERARRSAHCIHWLRLFIAHVSSAAERTL